MNWQKSIWLQKKSKGEPYFLFKGLRFLPALGVMGGIFLLSHIPGNELAAPQIAGLDKFAHLFLYALLTICIIFSFSCKFRQKRPQSVVFISFAVGISYAIIDELHQLTVPGRSSDVADLVADAIGILLVLLCWYRLRLRE